MPNSQNRRIRTLSLIAGATLVAGGVFAGTATASPGQQANDDARAMVEACTEGNLCVWDGPNGQGNRHDFYQCSANPIDVRNVGLARVGSYVNNQTDGTVATFHGPDNPPGPWHQQYDSTAFEFWDNNRDMSTFGVDPC